MPTEAQAVLFFVAVILGLGHGLLWGTRATREGNIVYALLETAGVGLAALSFLGVVFHLLHVPLRPAAYLLAAAVGPGLWARARWRGVKGSRPALRADRHEEAICAVLLVLLLGTAFCYFDQGANAYPYLEDDDPWLHAQAALYVAQEHTFSVDPPLRALGGFSFYLEPYPPTYDVIMGVLRQVHDSVYFTLKFFNVLLVTLAIGFFFLFFKEYFRSARKAMFGALVLAALPSFMSHFIWSQTLALCVFPVAFAASLRALTDRSWTMVAIMAIASMLVTQPVVSAVFGVVFFLFVVAVFAHEARAAREQGTWGRAQFPMTLQGVLVGAGGLAGSLLYWVPQVVKWGFGGLLRLKGGEVTGGWAGDYALQRYSVSEVLFPPSSGRIDQATGWGLVVAVAVAIAVATYIVTNATVRHERRWRQAHLLVWFVALCYAVFAPSLRLPAWGSARSWAYLAIPVAMLATEGVFFLAALAGENQAIALGVVALAACGVAWTSAPPKISLQTQPWPPGQEWAFFAPNAEGMRAAGLDGYVQMRDALPRNTRVYSICGSDGRTIGFDMAASPWDPSEAAFRQRGLGVTAEETIAFLEQHGYAYLTADALCTRAWGEGSDQFLTVLGKTGRLERVLATEGFVLARLLPAPPAETAHGGASTGHARP